MITVIDDTKQKHVFDLETYKGQDYFPSEFALTVVIVEDTVEVYLVPLTTSGSIRIGELHDYLDLTSPQWSKTHTLFRRIFCDFINKEGKYEVQGYTGRIQQPKTSRVQGR